MNDRTLIGLRLLNEYQRDFPLVAEPYGVIADQLGLDEATVIDAYREGLASGAISRIGAVVAPRRIGASTLAAMAVPPDRLEEVAARVNARVEVNHNYEREDHWNLWFVVAARDEAQRAATLAGIGAETGLPVLALPLVKEYHIDLGFDLRGGERARPASAMTTRPACALPGLEAALLAALQEGLPLVTRPFSALGARAGLSEAMAIEIIETWLRDGVLKRFGVVVRHRELGYTANAMCVWDVAEEKVDDLGRQLARFADVTLCYRRERAMPHWPYNLYCMIHGKARDEVLALRRSAAGALGLDMFPHRVLFSQRRFKQCGARYLPLSGVLAP